jgi:hypothetical protein
MNPFIQWGQWDLNPSIKWDQLFLKNNNKIDNNLYVYLKKIKN